MKRREASLFPVVNVEDEAQRGASEHHSLGESVGYEARAILQLW